MRYQRKDDTRKIGKGGGDMVIMPDVALDQSQLPLASGSHLRTS
jgi:hypothetical protein